MPPAHTLTLALGPDGLAYVFACPYDDSGVDKLAPLDRPDCRRTGADCTGRTALAEAGSVAAVWAGPRTVLATLPVDVRLQDPTEGPYDLLVPLPAGPPSADEAAQQLARASGSARYCQDEYGWEELLVAEHLVEHAYRAALRRGTDKKLADAWCQVLRAWHENESALAAATGDTAGVRT